VKPYRSDYTTKTQADYRRRAPRRVLAAGVLAVAALGLVVLFGPSAESVQKRFTYYGAPGEIHIMREISITESQDERHQLPKSLSQPPPAPLAVEQDEHPKPKGQVTQPVRAIANEQHHSESVPSPVPGAVADDRRQSKMSLPRQSSRDFTIETMVNPIYPLGATQRERRTRVIVVQVGLFVNVAGEVAEAMVLTSTGSRAFDEAALTAVRQWKFSWLITPTQGRWLQFPVNFRSPYPAGATLSPVR